MRKRPVAADSAAPDDGLSLGWRIQTDLRHPLAQRMPWDGLEEALVPLPPNSTRSRQY